MSEHEMTTDDWAEVGRAFAAIGEKLSKSKTYPPDPRLIDVNEKHINDPFYLEAMAFEAARVKAIPLIAYNKECERQRDELRNKKIGDSR